MIDEFQEQFKNAGYYAHSDIMLKGRLTANPSSVSKLYQNFNLGWECVPWQHAVEGFVD